MAKFKQIVCMENNFEYLHIKITEQFNDQCDSLNIGLSSFGPGPLRETAAILAPMFRGQLREFVILELLT